MRRLRVLAASATALLAGAAVISPTAPAATAGSRWAPAAKATITPGVQMYTKGAQCTGNFVFTDRRGRVYVGYAAHCAGKGAATDTNGCETASHPIGTAVTFKRGSGVLSAGETVGTGRLVYSSWVTMRRLGTKASSNPCEFNDFALVRVGGTHVRKVNPSVPFWGGPTRVATESPALGSDVFSYGNSSLREGREELSPKQGVVTGHDGNGWSHYVETVTPGIPGDSGSGFLDAQGRAFGTLSTVAVAPIPLENGLGDLAKELAFAKRHSGIGGLRLVPGTVPFNPDPTS
jgi:hypothetical protein